VTRNVRKYVAITYAKNEKLAEKLIANEVSEKP